MQHVAIYRLRGSREKGLEGFLCLKPVHVSEILCQAERWHAILRTGYPNKVR